MTLYVLSPEELQRRRQLARARPEYVAFFATLPPGHGGLARPAEEGLTPAALRRELARAAAAHGVHLRFVDGLPDEVAFEIEGPVTPRALRRWHRRSPGREAVTGLGRRA